MSKKQFKPSTKLSTETQMNDSTKAPEQTQAAQEQTAAVEQQPVAGTVVTDTAAAVEGAPAVQEKAVIVVPDETVLEIQDPAPEATIEQQPVVASGKVVAVEADKPVEQSAFEKKIAKVLESGSVGEKTIVNYFTAYIDAMKPGKPQEPKKGASSQQTLWRGILTVLGNEEDFVKSFPLMISYVREHQDGVFADQYVFRFAEEMTIGKDQITAYHTVMTILKIAAGLKNKTDMKKHVDLNRGITPIFKDTTRQQIINYFS